MKVRYHQRVPEEVADIQNFYCGRSDESLADEFMIELKRVIRLASGHPERFPALNEQHRRANLRRFPYHILYEMRPGYLYVIVVRHHKRHPAYGLSRR